MLVWLISLHGTLADYDANVQFVNKELKPRIEDVRRTLAERYQDKVR